MLAFSVVQLGMYSPQMLLDLAASLSAVSSGMTNEKQKQNIAFRNPGQINNPDYVVPDGMYAYRSPLSHQTR